MIKVVELKVYKSPNRTINEIPMNRINQSNRKVEEEKTILIVKP